MSDKNVAHQADNDDVMMKLEAFWKKYQKQVLIAIGAVIVVIGGWYAYQNMVVAPQEEQAADAIYKAEANFAKDSLVVALNGDASSKGFLYVINNFGGTKSGNLAKYYAGVCYLRTGDFNNAVKYLSDFSTDSKQIQMMAYGCLGDAYAELNKNDDAVANYKKAATTFEDDAVNASEFLYRAALKLEVTGKTTEAVELYKQLKDKFPDTDKGRLADKYIYRLSIEPNDFTTK
ncbi:tetratricopeptide repeat protein [Limnovirga soli]|uniref:Tetratricopeptide repeat protein n=1 Tax=Limnovirga soli TaxID=2656915 RepID=A0A8J8FGR5_9BACT|nr:tetratricopeptide repeat protein [Limnovirga soli]NNV57765.1 tetratricopeptide repeat protein [Limnovirga soli]